MKLKFKITIQFVLILLFVLYNKNLLAQKTKSSNYSNSKKLKSNHFWIFGLGGNVVDDDGSPFKHLFGVLPRWNVKPYPTRITAERSLNDNFSIEGALNFTTYKSYKIINNATGKAGLFLSLDVNIKNRFKKLRRFDPYVVYGLGGTYRTVRSFPIGGNINLGLGTNIWLTHVIGINIQSIAKFGLSPTNFIKTSQNYLQHSLSLIFKIQKNGKRAFIKPRYKWVHRKKLYEERK